MGIFDSLYGKQKLPDWYKGEIYKKGYTIKYNEKEFKLSATELCIYYTFDGGIFISKMPSYEFQIKYENLLKTHNNCIDWFKDINPKLYRELIKPKALEFVKKENSISERKDSVINKGIEIKDILKMNPESECNITYNGSESWDNCYYQLNNESNTSLELNDLPVLEDKFFADTGKPLINDKEEYVYDPNQEIKFKQNLFLNFKQVYKSKSFIALIQNKIKELIKLNEISSNSEVYELWEEMGLDKSRVFVENLVYELNCNDLISESETQENLYLWFTSAQMSDEEGEFTIEEINN